MKDKEYSVEELVLDKSFREWVYGDHSTIDNSWNEYIRKNPSRIQTLRKARQILLSLPQEEHHISEERVNDLWRTIEQDIVSSASHIKSTETPILSIKPSSMLAPTGAVRTTTPKYRRMWWTAAVVAIFASTIFVLQQFTEAPAPQVALEDQMIEKTTAWGQKMRFFLSDGSEVILNAGSSIRYRKYLGEYKREIELLTGEAYYKVATDPARPFVVRTQDLTTTALGTEFNVRIVDPDASRIFLTEGQVRVALNDGGEDIFPMVGEAVEIGEDGHLSSFTFDEKAMLSWKDGILYFENAGEREVFEKLENWYGVEVNITNEAVKPWAYNGEFQNKSLETVLISLGFAMDFQFEIQSDTITIKYN